MAHKKSRRPAILLLAALMLALSACAPSGDNPDASAGTTPAPPPTEAAVSGQVDPLPSAQDSGSPSPDESPSEPAGSDSPSQSVSPTPSQSDSPSPSQSDSPSQSASPSQSESASAPPEVSPTPPGLTSEGEDVGNEWFSDAVFLGDSRTDGLRLYSGIKGASFICHTGLSVFTVGSNACIKTDGVKITAMDALARQQWAKVYLMLGVNELGYSTASFKSAYTEVVEQIKELQPGAAVYLQTLIPVNEAIAYKNGTSRAINNAKLKEFNGVITEIAQEQGVFLVDVDTPFWSADGCLAAENTGDGVHLTRAGYVAWFEYLKTHTGAAASVEYWPSAEPWPSAESWMPVESWPSAETWMPAEF